MCSVYHLEATAEELMEVFATLKEIDFLPRYNIRPSEAVPTIRQHPDGSRTIELAKWGFVATWAEAPDQHHTLARSESVSLSPTFRSAIRNKRCIIPANGFFEWENTSNRTKQKWEIAAPDKSILAFAGIWDRRVDDGQESESFAILTTHSNDLVMPMNDRMPVILRPEAFALWLDRGMTEVDQLRPLYPAVPSESLKLTPVANIHKEDSPRCIEPAKLQRGLFD